MCTVGRNWTTVKHMQGLTWSCLTVCMTGQKMPGYFASKGSLRLASVMSPLTTDSSTTLFSSTKLLTKAELPFCKSFSSSVCIQLANSPYKSTAEKQVPSNLPAGTELNS